MGRELATLRPYPAHAHARNLRLVAPVTPHFPQDETVDTFVPLTRITPEIQRLTSSPGPGYLKLKRLAYDSKIPADVVEGQWGVFRRNLPELCRALGLPIIPAKDVAPERTAA